MGAPWVLGGRTDGWVDPTAPGGVMWDRETRVPKEICEKGWGKGVLETY